MIKVLHGVWWLLTALILLMWFTGGWILNFKGVPKIEFSSLDPWVWAWGLFYLGLRSRIKVEIPFNGFWQRFRGWSASRAALPVLMVVIFGVLTLAHALKHGAGMTSAYDVIFLHQPLFYPYLNGIFLKCDFCLQGTFFGDHISPILFLVAPITALFKSDFLVFVLQSLILGLGVTVLLRDKKNAFILALIFLSHRALRGAAVWDFREDDLAFLFLIGALVFSETSKRLGFVFSIVAALLCKENMGVVVAAMALPFWLQKKRFEAGLSLVLGLFWTVLCFKFLIPHFNQGVETSNNIVVRFPGLGSTPKEVFINLLTQPSTWWDLLGTRVLTREAIKYLVLLIGPVVFCFSRHSLIWLIPAIPGVAMNLLSVTSAQRSLQFHYDLIVLPFLFYAVRVSWDQSLKRGVGFLLFFAVALSGRWPGAFVTQYLGPAMERATAQSQLSDVLAVSQSNQIVCVDLKVGALASRLPDLRQAYDAPPDLSVPNMDRTHLVNHSMQNCTQWIVAPEFLARGQNRLWINKIGLRIVKETSVFVVLER